jgi:hypothetical protein
MRRTFTRAIALATAAVIAVTAFEPQLAGAAPAKRPEAAPYASGDVEASSQRRRVRRRGGGPPIGAFFAIVGSIAAIAAANRRREYYIAPDGYSYGPGDAYYDDYPYGYYSDDYGPGYVAPRVYGPAYRGVAPRVFVPRGGSGHISRGGGGGHISRGGGGGGGGGGHAHGGGSARHR